MCKEHRLVTILLGLFVGVLALPATARAQSYGVDLANLREDVHGLSQKVAELQLRVEQLEKENGDLRARTAGATQNYATVTQLNQAIAEMNQEIKAAAAATKNETLQQVSGQMEKLAKQTNAAIDSLAKGVAATHASPVSPPAFADDYPKEGVTYTVQKGDTLPAIARKTGAKQKDIVNANKLSEPSKIQAGQTLFIPGGK